MTEILIKNTVYKVLHRRTPEMMEASGSQISADKMRTDKCVARLQLETPNGQRWFCEEFLYEYGTCYSEPVSW